MGGDRENLPHYYGGVVRTLFIVNAAVLLIAASTGADLPLSDGGTVFSAIVLIIAAGVTNPTQVWIHWINEMLSIVGIALFAMSAISHYRAGMHLSDPPFFFIEVLALLFLLSLYYATKTIRGVLLRRKMALM